MNVVVILIIDSGFFFISVDHECMHRVCVFFGLQIFCKRWSYKS